MKYYRPSTLTEALTLLRQPGSAALAGGTSLLADRPTGLASVVDLSALGLDSLRREGDFLVAGAMTRLQTLATATDIGGSAGDVLREAARLTLPRPQRDMATLGGTLVSAQGELVAALLALGAEVTLDGDAESWLALEDFLSRRGADRSPTRLIVEVRWPASISVRCALSRVARTLADAAIVSAVACVSRSSESIKGVRLALGGLTRAPFLLPSSSNVSSAQAILESLRPLVQDAPAISDFIASAEYRRDVAVVVARRALTEAWERAGGAG